MPNPKIFKHQSGLMQAVQADLKEVLKATVVMVEKVKSDPPPKGSLYPVDPGFYSIAFDSTNPGLVEQIAYPKKVT
jgi:hypothetical protein